MVSLEEFSNWWKNYKDLLVIDTGADDHDEQYDTLSRDVDVNNRRILITQNTDVIVNDVNLTEHVHFAGFLSPKTTSRIDMPQQILRVSIPSISMFEGFLPPVFGELDDSWDWNTNFQTSLEYAFDTQCVLSSEDGHTAAVSSTANIVDAILKLSSLMGAFYTAALAGKCATIITV